MNKKILKPISVFIWILIWQIASMIINKELILPSPYITVITLAKLMTESSFYYALIYSLLRIVCGFLFAALFALVLGVLSGLSERAEIILTPFITVIRSTPVMSFIILAIIWFSYNYAPLAVNIIMCFPPIYDNVVKGIKNTDKKLLDMAKVYHVSKPNIFKGIYLTSLIPFLAAGMNTAIGLSFRVAVAAEVLANPKYGIGTKLLVSKINLDTAQVFAWTLVILVLSYIFEHLFKKITEGGKYNAQNKKSD